MLGMPCGPWLGSPGDAIMVYVPSPQASKRRTVAEGGPLAHTEYDCERRRLPYSSIIDWFGWLIEFSFTTMIAVRCHPSLI